MFRNPFGPVAAELMGMQIYEFILTNWGNLGVNGCNRVGPSTLTSPCADPYALGYPAKLTDEPIGTVVGIAIAPRSDVDRCVITFNSNPPPDLITRIGSVVDLQNHSDGLVELTNDQLVSVERPWFGQINGPLAIRADASQWFSDTYFPDDLTGLEQPFASAVLPLGFNPPTLRLQIFTSGLVPAPVKRVPFSWRALMRPSVADGPMELITVLPVMGRRKFKVVMHLETPFALTTATVKIGGVKSGNLLVLPAVGQNPDSTECTLLAATTLVDNGAHVCVQFDEPQVDFLTVYLSMTNDNNPSSVKIHIDAID